ncbi:Cytochrome P450 [Penicillium expansum]|uniref:Cytochrome P450 n=1 Tax=Penicillium expansum TaxID=27334 RepID=A0A0A2IXI1_PENEN|nr:Cytochrome P450 [Penicillium expansum]KGO47754.1 Cytochrome P450 [Penicillium expansum]KGO58655.1 Cytochrome P450 [Penicillium expansum]KGO58771.1 Cytochrome P450 [Penicillium expansum]
MTQYPEALLFTYTDAYAATRPPSLVELNKTRVPYLEGVLEEALRLHATSVARQAVWDTEVFAPSLSVDEKLRNKHTKANDRDESRNLSAFHPER